MPTTPDLAIPYPAGPDAADGPGAFQALAEMVEQLLLERTPTGTVRASISETADAGWLVLDGTEKEKATFPDLDALISTLGYPWGSTATHFTLPDYRGRALYGKGTHADVNSLADTDGLALASRRPKHAHGDGTLAAASHSHGDGSLAAASHSHSDGTLAAESHAHGDGSLAAASHTHGDGTLAAASHSHGNGTLAVASHSHDDGTLEADNTLTAMEVQAGTGASVPNPPHHHDVIGDTGEAAPAVVGAMAAAAPDVSGATAAAAPDVSGATAAAAPDVSGATGSAGADVTGTTGSAGADVTGATADDGSAYGVVGSWQIKT